MRYLTKDLEIKMQFFHIATDDMTLQTLIEHWKDSSYPQDVHKIFYEDLRQNKEHMLRLLPDPLRNKLFYNDGNIRKDILSDELYEELVEYNKASRAEWEKACKTISDEFNRIKPTLPKAIKKYTKLSMHDERINDIYLQNDNDLIFELAERKWGKPALIFRGVENPLISNTIYPAWWLYDELFGLNDGKYELNVLFDNGEISFVFNGFDIVIETKKYGLEILSDYSPSVMQVKIDEIISHIKNIEMASSDENLTSNMPSLLFGDRNFFNNVCHCIGDKLNFAGSRCLNIIEKNILLLNEIVTNLLYDSLINQYEIEPGGFHKLASFSSTKLDKIIDLLSNIGPKYLYKITLEAKYILEEPNTEEKSQKIIKLNNRMYRRYRSGTNRSEEIYSAFANYVKLNIDKF